MKLADFKIGMEFMCDDNPWRVTDIGTRVILAIKLDNITIARMDKAGRKRKAIIKRKEAEEEGWFNGPPYAVQEIVFDEIDMEACSPAQQP